MTKKKKDLVFTLLAKHISPNFRGVKKETVLVKDKEEQWLQASF